MHSDHHRAESMSNTCPSAWKAVSDTLYSHVSTYRSLKLELQIYSSSIRVQHDNRSSSGLVPVFNTGDRVSGKVILDPSCHNSGTITITVEGIFNYKIAQEDKMCDQGMVDAAKGMKEGKHVFLSASTRLPITPNPITAPQGRLQFREAFMRRRPSASSIGMQISPAQRTQPFSLDLLHGCGVGDELPPTFKAESHARNSLAPEEFRVDYKVTATWEPRIPSNDTPSMIEVPILIHDEDFQSKDLVECQPDSWLELPLRSDHPVPFRCAVTLPTSATFLRGSSIPYFVVFTTTPRSPQLAKEIASDATISVSLVRKLTVSDPVNLPPSPPQTPASASEESDSGRNKLLKRSRLKAAKPSGPRREPEPNSSLREKPLPRLPTHSLYNTILKTNVCIGFPKRPRHPSDSRRHPSLEEMAKLPDGLQRSKISLKKNLLPCIEVPGFNVKYYLDVSVLFGQDDLRARIPIRVT
ncbi:hypothetical protein AMATHDRAFT_62247 [Amanita thiersii Skay4041]|uniref:Uncharacterized protein n=1 Tax=Amanita thiersii Skay4041 TaxID=703135 RepID=A0A2A9NQH0_9AGAR|nr:hypothetical protein AMATHDRAFT_62247 [Amanita thiersii Skay4041]